MKKHVFEEQSFTMDELLTACKADFAGYENVFDIVHNQTPKYGNDDDYADDLLRDVAQALQDAIAGRRTPKGS